MKKNSQEESATNMRQKAKAVPIKKSVKMASQYIKGDTLKLIHQLEVHHIELEMQKEELILAKEKVKSDADKYSELYDFAPSGYFTVNREGDIIELNLYGAKMLGKERAHLINSRLHVFISGSTKAIFNEFLNTVFKSKKQETAEVIFKPIGNKPLCAHLVGIVNADLCMLTAVDITDIENIKEVLKNSENKYHQLFDQMLNGFASHEIICNSEGKPVDYRFIEINNSFSTMTGLNSDIIGKTCLEILPDIEPFWIDNYGDVALKGKTICFEQFNVSLNKYFEVTAYSTQKGQFITLFNDITERKIFEKDLLKTNIFLDSIIENIPNMVFLKEAQELRFVRINKAGEDLLGVSEKEMLGKNDYDFFPKEQADFFIKKDRQVLNGKDILDIPEEPIHTKYQGIRILHTQKVPLFDARGNPEYLLGISVDITERKEAEKKLKEKMDELQRFHRLTIGREMFMIELKKEVNELLKSVGREEKYKIVG